MHPYIRHALVNTTTESLDVTGDDICDDPPRSHLYRFVPHPTTCHRGQVGDQGFDNASLSRILLCEADFRRKKGRQNYWGAKLEELGSLRFDVQVDLQPLLESYNTKQLFLYLTANFDDKDGSASHEVVLWDRIITRGDVRDFRTVDKDRKKSKGPKRGRGKVRVEEGKNKYPWKTPTGSFK